jgi:hypothetical protein
MRSFVTSVSGFWLGSNPVLSGSGRGAPFMVPCADATPVPCPGPRGAGLGGAKGRRLYGQRARSARGFGGAKRSAQSHLHGRTTGRCAAALICGRRKKKKMRSLRTKKDAKWLCRTGHMYWVTMPSAGLGWGFSELDHKTWDKPEDGWKVWDPHIPNREAGLPAADLGANARATGEVLAVEQSSNNDKGDVLAELKKQQREPPFKAPQVDAPGQHPVLAEILATNPADARHSTKKFGLYQQRPSPDSPCLVSYKQLHISYLTAYSCAPRPRRPVRPRFRGRLRRLRQRFRWPRLLGGGGFPRG